MILCRPRLAQRRRLERPRGARRSLNASVLTDMKIGAAFPTDHPLHVGAPAAICAEPAALEALQQADVMLSLDWVDSLGQCAEGAIDAVVVAGLARPSHPQWLEHGPSGAAAGRSFPDRPIRTRGVGAARGTRHRGNAGKACRRPSVDDAGAAERQGHRSNTWPSRCSAQSASATVALTHLPLSWNGAWWPFRHPLDYLGSDGGGGIGGGPGISVGAALALKGSDRLPIAICGDGDYLMGVTALWTAAHYRIPLLIVVANNRSFFNDELHQERVARMRHRPVENRWIGQRISDPDIDLAGDGARARRAGLRPGHTQRRAAPRCSQQAIAAVEAGACRRGRRPRRAGLHPGDDRRTDPQC